jgi:hypothetical protein
MTIDFVTLKDFNGGAVKIAVDIDSNGINWQVYKLAFGTLDTGFTAVDASNPLPVKVYTTAPLPVLVDPTTPIGVTVLAATAPRSPASNVTNVASSATNVTLLAANANRGAATIYNDSTSVLYLKLGAGASSSSFTIMILPSDYYELPVVYIAGIPGVYQLQVDGVWVSANGNARITELA